MKVAIRIRQHEANGFTAELVGVPGMSRSGANRKEVVEALRQDVRDSMQRGEFEWMDIEAPGAMAVFGTHASDPYLENIVNDIYRQRDAERPK
jgi:hypothetical protein